MVVRLPGWPSLLPRADQGAVVYPCRPPRAEWAVVAVQAYGNVATASQKVEIFFRHLYLVVDSNKLHNSRIIGLTVVEPFCRIRLVFVDLCRTKDSYVTALSKAVDLH